MAIRTLPWRKPKDGVDVDGIVCYPSRFQHKSSEETTPMTLSKRPATIAIIFLTAWTGVLLAGADHPPPMGFLRLIPILIGCAILVYLRVPTYTDWSENRESGRIIKVAAEGLLGGMIVGLLVILLSATGEPNVLLTHGAEYGIWLTVLGIMGAVNALLVYVCSSLSKHDP